MAHLLSTNSGSTESAFTDPYADPSASLTTAGEGSALSTQACEQLCALAVKAIRSAVIAHTELKIEQHEFSAELWQQAACFVTLESQGRLRGCIGSLEAHRALALDVVANAFAACRRDPRFAPVEPHELPQLSAEVSVLSALVPLNVNSQDQLIGALRPHVDGLVIDDGVHRATFLPSVWTQLPDRGEFVAQLKRKAGLGTDAWSPAIQCFRYTARIFHIDSLQ